MKKPDFKNLKNTLMLKDRKSIPIVELLVEKEIKEKVLGKEILTIEDEIEFQIEAGYDYIGIASGILEPTKTIGKEKDSSKEKWADEDKGLIYSDKTFEKYPWIDPKDFNYSAYKSALKYLSEGMKIIGIGGKIYTSTWMLMGLNNFSISLFENYGLVEKVFNKIGEIQFENFKRVISYEKVEAYWVVDDIAYTEGLMISAKILRDNLFPWYKKMGDICRKNDIAFIYHSDGVLFEVIEDLINCGFTALHPIEPKSMELKELIDKYSDKLCFLGNIELDYLIRKEEKDIEALVKNNIETVAEKGFYAVGSSNSVTKEVKLKNYRIMNKTAFDLGRRI